MWLDLSVLCQNIGNYHKDTGNLSRMMQAYQKMLDILSPCASRTRQCRLQKRIGHFVLKLGDTHSALGDLQQALTYFEEYNRLEKELHEAFPQNVGFKNGLAISYSNSAIPTARWAICSRP
jgi:tetratricopeptide (TPR) repeat protein